MISALHSCDYKLKRPGFLCELEYKPPKSSDKEDADQAARMLSQITGSVEFVTSEFNGRVFGVAVPFKHMKQVANDYSQSVAKSQELKRLEKPSGEKSSSNTAMVDNHHDEYPKPDMSLSNIVDHFGMACYQKAQALLHNENEAIRIKVCSCGTTGARSIVLITLAR